jgi:hypothetical protein
VTASLGKEAPEGTEPPITHRLDTERDVTNKLYTITAHHPNYFLLGSYSQHRPSSVSFVLGS